MILASGRVLDLADARAGEWGSSAIPAPGGSSSVASQTLGRWLTPDQAAGLPAAMAAIRLVAEVQASLELGVFRRRADGTEERVRGRTSQVRLIEDPSLDYTPFDFYSDIGAQVEGFGNGFAQKMRGPDSRVGELVPLDPDRMRIRREQGVKVFDYHPESGAVRRGLTSRDILHVRGFSLHGLLSGISPVAAHANSIARGLALEEFAGRFFANDATPGVVLKVPGNLTVKAAQRQLLIWELHHRGARNSHRPAIVYNGTEIERLGVSALDAQLIEGLNYGVVDTARMYRVPASLLEAFMASKGQIATVEQEALRFLSFYLLPRLRRLASAFNHDADLFRGTGLYCRFITDDFVRVDARTQAEVDHNRIQDGTRTRDELRARDGLDALPPQPADPLAEPGKVIPVTPVGAGANELAPAPAGAEDEEE